MGHTIDKTAPADVSVVLLGESGTGKEVVARSLHRLSERRNQKAGSLSGGEQQMLAIGRCLMAEPSLIMLDEPSLGLAPNLAASMFEIVKTLHNEGKTILLVEQNVQECLEYCDRAYVLENGRIVLEGSGAALLEDDRVREAYLGL